MNQCTSFYAHDPALQCSLKTGHEGLHKHQDQPDFSWGKNVAELIFMIARLKAQKWNEWPFNYNYTAGIYSFPEPGRFVFLTTSGSDVYLMITGIEARCTIRRYKISIGWCELENLENDFREWWGKVLAEWPSIRFWLGVN